MVYDSICSPIGEIFVVIDDNKVREVVITAEEWQAYCQYHSPILRDPENCREAISQLEEYFAGQRKEFTIPLAIEGSDFHCQVWQALLTIPYGQTRSYGEIAAQINRPKAYRAVGQANRRNPIPIFIPCHRVVGSNGSLTGYMGNRTDLKQLLLKIEGKI